MTELQEPGQRAVDDHRLDAIAQVAAGLSHECRGALQRIGASAEMLEFDLQGNPAALKHLARIQQAQTRLRNLFEDVQSYAALEALDNSSVRISEAWRQAWQSLLPLRQRRETELRERVLAKNLIIEGDHFRLVQVFRNLFENSLAAAPDPVRIDISCEDSAIDTMPALRIVVRDNGPGLDDEQRRRLFEPFYTTKPTGTGLGMAIAQRIINAHGGTIAVGDIALSGTELVIELPR